MGLDMYLNRRIYVENWDDNPIEEHIEVTLKKGGKKVKLNNPTYIIDQLMYWRKANSIHKWFVDNCGGGEDNCEEIYVGKDSLRKLKEVIEKVLSDHNKANELLPTSSGFFFGGTEYDEWYFKDLSETLEVINEVLDDDIKGSITYQASW